MLFLKAQHQTGRQSNITTQVMNLFILVTVSAMYQYCIEKLNVDQAYWNKEATVIMQCYTIRSVAVSCSQKHFRYVDKHEFVKELISGSGQLV